MELREFVAQTLTQIFQGVREAQSATAALGARVNPGRLTFADGVREHVTQRVAFDVALTVDKSDTKEGKVGVAAVFAAGVAGKLDSRNQVVSRVSFSVPIELPLSAPRDQGTDEAGPQAAGKP